MKKNEAREQGNRVADIPTMKNQGHVFTDNRTPRYRGIEPRQVAAGRLVGATPSHGMKDAGAQRRQEGPVQRVAQRVDDPNVIAISNVTPYQGHHYINSSIEEQLNVIEAIRGHLQIEVTPNYVTARQWFTDNHDTVVGLGWRGNPAYVSLDLSANQLLQQAVAAGLTEAESDQNSLRNGKLKRRLVEIKAGIQAETDEGRRRVWLKEVKALVHIGCTERNTWRDGRLEPFVKPENKVQNATTHFAMLDAEVARWQLGGGGINWGTRYASPTGEASRDLGQEYRHEVEREWYARRSEGVVGEGVGPSEVDYWDMAELFKPDDVKPIFLAARQARGIAELGPGTNEEKRARGVAAYCQELDALNGPVYDGLGLDHGAAVAKLRGE